MMALMPRKAIYLFDVCLLVLFVDRVAPRPRALRLAKSGGGHPPKMLAFVAAIPLRKFCEKILVFWMYGEVVHNL